MNPPGNLYLELPIPFKISPSSMSTTKTGGFLQLRFVEKSASPGVVPNLFGAALWRPEGRKKEGGFFGSSSCVFF